jgi:hypothetical protein
MEANQAHDGHRNTRYHPNHTFPDGQILRIEHPAPHHGDAPLMG